jgi:hypothetical protein
MSQTAEVIEIEELRRRRTQREAVAAPMPPAVPSGWYVPVWYAWVPVWRPSAPSLPLLRAAAGWGGR